MIYGAGADDAGLVTVRRKGGGRPSHDEAHPGLVPALEKLVDPATRGDPMSPLRWTCKSAVVLSREVFQSHGIRVSDKTVGKVLRKMGYSLQAAKQTVEGAQHPDRNAQFEHINATANSCIARSVPFISVDTKKKELVGNFKKAGVEWQPKDAPELVDVHDFPSDAIGKADWHSRQNTRPLSGGSALFHFTPESFGYSVPRLGRVCHRSMSGTPRLGSLNMVSWPPAAALSPRTSLAISIATRKADLVSSSGAARGVRLSWRLRL